MVKAPSSDEFFAGYVPTNKLGGSDQPVFKALHHESNQPGIIRFLATSQLQDAVRMASLRDDIEAVRAIDNPHVAKLSGLYEKDDQPFVVAEFVSGVNLQQLFDSGTTLTVEQATEIVEQIAIGLAALHSEGIPHGDVCPAHIQITPSGDAVLLNAGAFTIYRDSSAVLPRQSDQATSSSLGHFLRADVFSLVLTLAYLTGNRQQQDQSFASFVDTIRPDCEADESRILASVPDSLHSAVQQALLRLDSQPDESAAQLAHLLRFASPRSTKLESLVDQTVPLISNETPVHEQGVAESQIVASVQQIRATRTRAIYSTAVCFLIPILVVASVACYHALAGEDFLESRMSPTAQAILTLPGQNGTWWPDDPHTFVLTPPIRERLVDEGLFPNEVPTSYHRWLSEQLHSTSTESDPSSRAREEAVKDVIATDEFLSAADEGSNPFSDLGLLKEYFDRMSGKKAAVDLHLRAVIAHQIGANSLTTDIELTGQSVGDSHTAVAETDSEGQEPNVRTTIAAPQSKTQWYDQAENDYQQALVEYAKHPMMNHALIARCRADLAVLLVQRERKLKAAQQWRYAREEIQRGIKSIAPNEGEDSTDQIGNAQEAVNSNANQSPKIAADPSPKIAIEFRVSCLCKESQIYRGLGQWRKAKALLETALDLLGVENTESESMTEAELAIIVASTSGRAAAKAYVFERIGWLNMDAWRVPEAKSCFEHAKAYRQHEGHFPPLASSMTTKLLRLHDMHGIAMSHRYLGDTEEAITSYTEILKQLKARVGRDQLTREESLIYRELQEERLLNSRERLADCFLFGPLLAPDRETVLSREQSPVQVLTETMNDIRKRQLLKQTRGEQLARILHKIALEHVRQGDFEKARKRLAEADRHHPPTEHSEKFRFLSEIVRSCIPPAAVEEARHATPHIALVDMLNQLFGFLPESSPVHLPSADTDRVTTGSTTLMSTLHDQFISLRGQGKITRDELDIALYAALLLFRADQVAGGISERETDEYVELLARLANYPLESRVVSEADSDSMTPVLPYLNGAYVAAIRLALEADEPRTDLAFELLDKCAGVSAETKSIRDSDTVLAVGGGLDRPARFLVWKGGKSPRWIDVDEGDSFEVACRKLPAEFEHARKYRSVRELVDLLAAARQHESI